MAVRVSCSPALARPRHRMRLRPWLRLQVANTFSDAPAHALDRAIDGRQLLTRVLVCATPDAGDGHPWPATPRADCPGVDVARWVRQRQLATAPVMTVAGRDSDPLCDGGVGIDPDMDLVAMDRLARAVAGPARLPVALAGRGDHAGVDDGPGLDPHRLRFQSPRHRLQQRRLKPMRQQRAALSHEGCPLGCGLGAREPAEAAKRGPIVKRLGQLHIGQIVPARQRQRPKHRQRRPARLSRPTRAPAPASPRSRTNQSGPANHPAMTDTRAWKTVLPDRSGDVAWRSASPSRQEKQLLTRQASTTRAQVS